ncbi:MULTISPECIES: flagellar motor protein MotB [Thioalkalivibrio]|uniref:Flagellar motor protein MotB n=1 Tax=Thioalkalivibrio versutus TaxID=106634 RepID=A0A0G3GA35_9GAMM|nr:MULTISPECIES: flagellar motor protein MotB [Thioalkalivibrio]AKJ95621.1 flagellar motor protein MotB [Thioalkalivibrio versutus]OOC47963.1 flagellar motor protein MotB [Thioalkalivibrio versutus]
MGVEDKTQPIIVKKKVVKAAHHGGSWKVAFADFATAMMAFFLLLWLLAAMEVEERAGLSEYFKNPSAFDGEAALPGQAPGDGTGVDPSIIDFEGLPEILDDPERMDAPVGIDEQTFDDLAEARDREALETLQRALEEAVEQSQALEPFKDQLLLDITPEGLRIQIIDRENRPMFDSASARPLEHADAILRELASLINKVPNRVSITGHTDARPLLRPDYTNWELSADRANAARRALIAGGTQSDQIAQVVGLAASVPFNRENPEAAINRRISIIVMSQQADDAMRQSLESEGVRPDTLGPADNGTAPPPAQLDDPS